MPRLILIRNTFKPYKRQYVPIGEGCRVADFLPNDFPSDRCIAVRNGQAIQPSQARDLILKKNDEVIFRVIPNAVITLPLWAAMIWNALLVNIVLSAAMYFINKALAPKAENKNTYDNTEESPTYGWNGIQNTMRNGEPMALIFGKHKVAGQYLSALTSMPEVGKNYLNLLIGLGAGPIGGINDTTEDADSLTGDDISEDFKLNNNPAKQFTDIEVSYRMGDWHQGTIPGFRDSGTISDSPNASLLYNAAYTYTTTSEIEHADLILEFPSGIYGNNSDGSWATYDVNFSTRYREYPSGSWTTPTTTTVSARTRSGYYKYISFPNLPSARYQFEITRTTVDDDQWHCSASNLVTVQCKTYDDVAYSGTALVALKALATEQLNGRIPDTSCTVYGRECKVYNPGDEFGEDTQQDFKRESDGKRYWGWSAENISYLDFAVSHTRTPGKLHVKHAKTPDGSTTSYSTGWSSTQWNAPRWYKKIYGDFTATVKVECPAVNNFGMGLYVNAESVGNHGAHVSVIYSDASKTYTWAAFDDLDNRGTTTSDALSSGTVWLKITKSEDTITFYTSYDNTNWTLRQTVEYTPPTHVEYFEVGPLVTSLSANEGEGYFSNFTVTGAECYSVETTSNPSWVVYHCLTDTHYGLGNYFTESQVDLDTFMDFADYCNGQVNNARGGTHRRYRFDGVIDGAPTAWDKLLEILTNYRATLLQQGDQVRVAWQCVKNPVQMFSMANIKENTFTASYETEKLRPNYWEVEYLNQENDYEQDYAVFIDPDIEPGEAYKKKTTSCYGITRPQEAYRAALFLCKYHRYVTQNVSFETGIEAICCEPFDVISVSHDTPAWGTGAGRVIQSTPTSITLDKPITLDENTAYVVKIRHKNDEFETQTVTNQPGTTWTITVASWTTRPQPSAVWVVGKTLTATKDFLITNITRTKDLECKIEGIEYVEDVYDDEVTRIPEIVYTELPDPRKAPNDIPPSSLVLAERAQVMSDGHVQNVIDVTWKTVFGASAYEIWYKESTATRWQYGGESRDIHFILSGVFVKGTTYDVAVVTVGPWGAKKSPGQSPSKQITIVGRTTRPADVSSIEVHEGRGIAIIKWAPVSDSDLLGYELRFSIANDWAGAQFIAGPLLNTEWTLAEYSPGTYYFLVKAINRSGLYSENAADVQAVLAGAADESSLATRDEVSEGWDGAKTKMTVVGSDLVTNAGETTGCYYETPEMDAGSSVTARLDCTVGCSTQTISDMTIDGTIGSLTLDSAMALATFIDASEDDKIATFQISYRAGDSSGNLGSYTAITADTALSVQVTAQYYQVKVSAAPASAAYQAKLTSMLTTVKEF